MLLLDILDRLLLGQWLNVSLWIQLMPFYDRYLSYYELKDPSFYALKVAFSLVCAKFSTVFFEKVEQDIREARMKLFI